MIPEAAIKAAIDALSMPTLRFQEAGKITWDEVARMVLEAAADILRAEGWDAYESAPFEIRLTEDGKNWEPFKVNPYRSQA